MSLAQRTLPEFDDEMARTRKVLAAVPRDQMDWKPNAEMRSIGWNANHIAEIVAWTSDILNKDQFDIAPVDGPKYETPTIDDPAAVLSNFDNALATARKTLSEASDDQLAEDWSLKMGGQTLSTMKKGACIRRWVLNHSIHHRAILSAYLRMCGVKITPVYDE